MSHLILKRLQVLAQVLAGRARCRGALKYLPALEDEADDDAGRRARLHLDRCADCRAAWREREREVESVREALAQHPRIAAPSDFDARVWAAIARENKRPVTLAARLAAFASRPVPRLLGSAMFGLVFALALGGAATLPRTFSASSSERTPSTPAAPASLPPDSMAALYATERRRLVASRRGEGAPQVLGGGPNRQRRSRRNNENSILA